MSENESVNDVESTESSSVPESTSNESIGENSGNKVETKTEQQPFHEHPRFKELVEQKNQFAKQAEEFKKQLQDMQSKFDKPKTPVEESKFVAALRQVDPEFAKWAETQEASRKELEEMRAWKAHTEQANYLTSARSTAEKLQSELKVSPELHQMYLTQIPMGTPLDKVGEMYKAINDRVAKVLEARDRDLLSKYTQGKKGDSKLPSSPRSQPVKAGRSEAKPAYPKNREDALAQIVSNTMRIAKNQ